jgi:biopolymer transport protein ExbD
VQETGVHGEATGWQYLGGHDMGRRRRKRRTFEGVELNLAAMLDMAFQLLMFFILTFSPTPIESQIAMALPAPQTVSQIKSPREWARPSPSVQPERVDRPVTVTVLGSDAGHIRDMAVDNVIVRDLPALGRQLRAVIDEAGGPDKNVILQVDTNLHYQDLMEVIEVCTQAGASRRGAIHKVTFVELRAEPGLF